MLRRRKCFLLVILTLASSLAYSQTTSETLQPTRAGLVPVHFPDLTKLEESVRAQITSAQDVLATTSIQSVTSETALGEAYSNMGQVYHAYSLTSPARECYLNAVRLLPKDFRWPYLLGKLDQQEGRFEDAINNYTIARTLKPDYIAALINLGNIFLELNRPNEALENFNRALALNKNIPAAYYGLGQLAMSQRRYTDAVNLFEKTLAQVPGANRVHYSLAMAYRGLGNSEKVKTHLALQGSVGVRVSDPLIDALQDLIEGERVHLSRGKLAFEAQRYSEAAVEFRKAVEAKPRSFTARVNLGAALAQAGEVKEAIEQLEEAIRLDPTKANAHFNLAILLARQNKHEEAISHVRAALVADENDLGARLFLAQELWKAAHFDEALKEYSVVVQLDPDNESALLAQVKLLYRKGQFKQALDALEKGHAQYPQKGRTAVMLAYAMATSPVSQLRNGSQALEVAQRVYAATGTIQHGVVVALALAELGRCNEAAEWQRRMITAAEQEGKADLVKALRGGLKNYEVKDSCRPPGDALLNEVPL